jgi:tRNA threonylcarbamoyladenosine biosynthesis protein TsaE
MFTKKIITLEQMPELAGLLINKLTSGMIIGLVGELGAGKTTLIQQLAKKLGISQDIKSPTFNLLKTYQLQKNYNGIEQLIHVDAYRLNSLPELVDLGFFDLINSGKTIAFIEWADRLPELNNLNNYWQIKFVEIANKNARQIIIQQSNIDFVL